VWENLPPFMTSDYAKHNPDNMALLITHNAPQHPVSVEEN
jgi:hypothetical protein